MYLHANVFTPLCALTLVFIVLHAFVTEGRKSYFCYSFAPTIQSDTRERHRTATRSGKRYAMPPPTTTREE